MEKVKAKKMTSSEFHSNVKKTPRLYVVFRVRVIYRLINGDEKTWVRKLVHSVGQDLSERYVRRWQCHVYTSLTARPTSLTLPSFLIWRC